MRRKKVPSVVTELEPAVTELVEEILGYQFGDRSLVAEALTHSTYYPTCKPVLSYERLEWVGDAVLNCLVAREVFTAYRALPQGPLTRLRSVNVDTEKLARVAVNNGLHHHLRHKEPQFEGQIQCFTEATLEYPIHSNGLLDPPKVLADIVESLLGAIFKDSNSSFETVWEVFKRLAEPLITLETLGKHPVSELQELCQKRRMQLRYLKDTCMANTTFEVFVDDNLVGSATYGQKEIAQTRAAKAALDRLKEELPKLDPILLSHTD